MKRYKVVTDNLRFVGLFNGFKFEVTEGYFKSLKDIGVPSKIWLNGMSYFILDVIKHNPDWFKEIKEQEYEVIGNKHELKFSWDDMLTFGRIIEGIFSKRDDKEPPIEHKGVYMDELTAKEWEILNGRIARKNKEITDFPITLNDMIDFARFVYDQVKPSTISVDMTLLDKLIQKAHPENCVTKK